MRRGSILILVLWVLCLLSVTAVYLSYAVRQKVTLVRRLAARDETRFIVQAGVKRAILELDMDDPNICDSMSDAWNNNVSAFKGIPVGTGQYSLQYEYSDPLSGKKTIIYGITDEERKVNINKADRFIMERLFILLGIDEAQSRDLAASIVDWRDPDGFLSLPLGSAEDGYYTNLKEPYDCKDAFFEYLPELLLVNGMTREVFDKIKDYVTIYGAGGVNINTASPEVLAALGLSSTLVDKIISFRHGKDNVIATDDDGIFRQSSAIAAQLSQGAHLSEEEAAQLDNLSALGPLVITSEYFMVRSFATLAGGEGMPKGELACVVKRSGELVYYDEL